MLNYKTLGTALVPCALAAASAAAPMNTMAGYVNMTHPTECVAPFLYQAGPMRWHENFVMNPPENIATWVICPISVDDSVAYDPNLDVSAYELYVAVIHGRADGASSETPQCYFSIHSGLNQKLDGYANGPGFAFNKPLLPGHIQNTSLAASYNTIQGPEMKTALGDAWGVSRGCPCSAAFRLDGGSTAFL